MKFVFLILIFFFKTPDALEYKQLETRKGIKFWFVEESSIPIISVSFSFRGGSSLEPHNKHGLMNLMSSLMDEGTSKYNASEFKNMVKNNGVKLNFSTQKDQLTGSFQVISTQKQKGFELFYEALNHPRFDKDDINKIKNQIVASIKIDQSNISTLASDKFNENFFLEHNFSKNVKGSKQSLQNITRDDLLRVHKKILQKRNLVIGVSGKISEREIKKLIDFVFGETGDDPKIKGPNPFSVLMKGTKVHKMQTPQTSVVFGHPGVSRKDEVFFALRIANYVLGGGGFQSRLYKNIREKEGLVYSVYSYLLSYENDGVIVGGFQTRNKSVNETINRVRNEWNKIQKNGISKQELEDAKAYFNGSFIRNFTSTISIANLLQIVQYYDLGEDYFRKRSKIINNLSLKEINSIIAEFFKTDQLFFMIVGEPGKK